MVLRSASSSPRRRWSNGCANTGMRAPRWPASAPCATVRNAPPTDTAGGSQTDKRKNGPADAAVLASARFAGASVVYSWDAKFAEQVADANRIDLLGITVEEPPELPVPDPVEPDDKLLTLFPDEDGDGTE